MLALALQTFALVASAAALFAGGDATAENRIVAINFVAANTDGHIIEDLHREDLRVSDAGEKRNIVFLRRIGIVSWDPPTLGPNEVSNRGGAFAPHATVVLLDLFNEDFPTQANASVRLTHDLESIPNADSMFLYILNEDGQVVPVHGIPFDLHFHYERPSSEPLWTVGIKSLMAEALAKGMGPRRPSITMSDHVNLTFQALDSIAIQLSRIPGRKNIVWINNGVPLAPASASRFSPSSGPSYSNALRSLSQRFNSFGVALYSLRPFLSSDSVLNAEGEGILDQLVADTGGRPNTGEEIADTIRQALRDARTSYQLGYEVPLQSCDGKLHKLHVSTNRKGIRIQTKASYLAASEPAGEGFSRMIDSAAAPPFDMAEIGVHGVLARDPENARVAHLRILVNTRDLALIRSNNQYTGILRLAVVGYMQGGRTVDAPVVPFELVFHHSEADHQEILNAGIQLNQEVALGARVTKIRLIVLDQTSQTIGTLTFPVEMKNVH